MLHLFCLQIIRGYKNINGVFWTLCVGVQFYMVYDFVLVAPLLYLALVRDEPAHWFLMAGLAMVIRSDNVARWTGFHGVNAGHFPSSLLDALAAILILAATVRLLTRDRDDGAHPNRKG